MNREFPSASPLSVESCERITMDGAPREDFSLAPLAAATHSLRVAAELREHLEDARRGSGRTLFLIGPASIERDLLLDQTTEWARAAEMGIGHGGCPPSKRSYGLWLAALHELRHDAAAEPGGAVDRRGEDCLSRLTATDAAEGQDFWAFDATALFLSELTRWRPLLLTLRDLDGADLPSLRLLHFLARTLHRSPLLLLGTHSGRPGGEVASFLNGELARESKRVFLR